MGRDRPARAAADIDLIVNAAPLGMNSGDPAPIPAHCSPHPLCSTVYRPSKTVASCSEAKARGAGCGLSALCHLNSGLIEAPIEAMRSL
jgi:shikimate 5-dehydrogenase